MYRPIFYNTFDKLRDLFDFNNFDDNNIDKKRIAVIGYGWGGRSFCKNINKNKFEIEIYEKNNYFLNTHKMKFILDDNNKVIIDNNLVPKEATAINFNNKLINNRKYDIIVVSAGSVINDYNIKGVKENCYFLKTYDDYIKLQNKVKLSNKNDKILIIGGGPTGIELASNLSKEFTNITIIDAFDILPGFTTVTRDYIKKKHNYVNYITNEKITEVINNNNNFIIKTIKRDLEFDIVIYTGGVKPSMNNINNNNNIYIIGDLNNNGPPTAQKANQEGKLLAHNLNNNLSEKFVYKEMGKILHLNNEIILEKNKNVLIFPKWTTFIFDLIIEYFN